MDTSLSPWVWAGLLGAAGGVGNALVTRDRRLLWSWVESQGAQRRVAQQGSLVSAILGAAAAVAVCVAFELALGSTSIAAPRIWPAALPSMALGFGTARLASGELDKRLLLAAASKAAAAPAAPPEVVRELERARPHAAHAIADRLMPRLYRRN